MHCHIDYFDQKTSVGYHTHMNFSDSPFDQNLPKGELEKSGAANWQPTEPERWTGNWKKEPCEVAYRARGPAQDASTALENGIATRELMCARQGLNTHNFTTYLSTLHNRQCFTI